MNGSPEPPTCTSTPPSDLTLDQPTVPPSEFISQTGHHENPNLHNLHLSCADGTLEKHCNQIKTNIDSHVELNNDNNTAIVGFENPSKFSTALDLSACSDKNGFNSQLESENNKNTDVLLPAHERHRRLINQYAFDALANTSVDQTSIISIETATTTLGTADTPPRLTKLDRPRGSISSSSRLDRFRRPRTVVRKFQQLDQGQLISGPAPDVKIGQRIAFKEYYGNEFGTIRWIGRVPQISLDWTVGVEFDNAIGEGDGSLNGRRYFIAKDCFAKFLPLDQVALVEQHVGRPEPGTMISVMSAAVRPGQMISIQRVSTVHVQHCFLNAPHHRPGAELLAVNTRLHCQCPSCGPCAHVVKPPRTQRLTRNPKNATHMCQFSTYTCCGMESQEEALCTYTGNKITASLPPRLNSPYTGLPPVGNSWIDGSGYLTSLQAQQIKSVPDEYKMGAAPEDIDNPDIRRKLHRSSSKRTNNHHTAKGSSRMASPVDNSLAINLPDHKPAVLSDSSELILHKQPSDLVWNSDNSMEPDLDAGSSHVCDLKPYEESTEQTSDGLLNGQQEINSSEERGLLPVSPAKVIHRDSIENHYLFPTDDDPIDSTLEADLENLSQARYGTKRYTGHRPLASRNIFRGLRSLVSCLNAPSDKSSELDSYSEVTLKFSDHPHKPSTNKSLPSSLRFKEEVDYSHDSTASSLKKPKKLNLSEEAYLKQYSNRSAQSPDYSTAKVPTGMTYESTKLVTDHVFTARVSSSSDCGFSSASQNSASFHPGNTLNQSITPNEELKRRTQIYEHVLTSLINSGQYDQELQKIRTVLSRPHSESCCLHKNISQVASCPEATEVDSLMTSLMHKFLEPRRISEGTCCAVANKRERSIQECSKTSHSSSLPTTSENRIHHQTDGLSLSSDANTVSSYDSLARSTEGTKSVRNSGGGNATSLDELNVDKTKAAISSSTTCLPKTFELKLTLSISPDVNQSIASPTNTRGQTIESQVAEGTVEFKDNKENPSKTLSMNIMLDTSDRKDLSSNSSSAVVNQPRNE